jgi:hypothetical protein
VKRLRPLFLVFLLLPVAGIAALSALNLPAVDTYLHQALPRWARIAGYELTVSGVDLEPWGPLLTLTGVELRPVSPEPEWEVSVARSAVRLRPLQSLLGVPHLEVVLDAPHIRGTLPAGLSEGGGAGGGGGPPRVVFHTLQVTGGSLELGLPERELELSVSGIGVDWLQDVGGGSARDVRIRWRGGEQVLTRVEISGARKFAALRLDQLLLEGPGVRLHGKGRIGPWRLLGLDVEGELDLGGIPDPWLEAMRLQRYAPLGGRVAVSGRVEGTGSRPEFHGSLDLRGGRFGVLQEARLEAQLEATAESLRFSRLRGTSNLMNLEQLSGELRWEDGLWLSSTGRVRNYRLRPFMGLFLEGFFPVELTADATIQAEGPLYPELALDARGELTVRDLVVTTGDEGHRQTRFSMPAAVLRTRLTVGRHEITFGPSRVESASADVEIASGRVRYREGLWFSTVGQIRSLELARPLLPDWLDARGRAEGRFGGPYRELEFHYDLDLDSVLLLGTDLGRLRGRGEYDLRELRVSGGQLQGPMGHLFADGAATLVSGGQHGWDLRWEQGDLAAVVELLRGSGVSLPVDLGARFRSEGRLSGPLASPEYAGQAQVSDLTVDRFHIGQVELSGRASPHGWEVPRVEFTAYGAQGEGSGRGNSAGFEAETRLSGLQVAALLEALDIPLAVSGEFNGSAKTSGAYRSPSVTVRGRVREPVAHGIRVPDSDLELTVDREALGVAVTALDGRLKGRFRRGFAKGALSARLEADRIPWDTLPLDRLPPELTGQELTGTAELEATPGKAGWERSMAARWRGVLGGMAWGDLHVGRVDLEGEYVAGGGSLRAEAWDGGLHVDGLYSPEQGGPLELSVRLTELPLSNLQPYLAVTAGVAKGKGRALLSWEKMSAAQGLRRLSALAELEVNVNLSGLRDARGLEFPDLDVRVTSPGGRPAWRVESQGLSLLGEVEDLDRVTWRTEVKMDRFEPWPFLPAGSPASALTGQFTGEGRVEGVGRQVRGAVASGRLEDLAWGSWGHSGWDWKIHYTWPKLSAELQEPRGVSAVVLWQPASGLELDLGLKDVPLAGWFSGEGLAAGLDGVVAGKGNLRWPPAEPPSGRLDLSRLGLERSPLRLGSDGPVQIRWEDGEVHVDRLALSGDGAQLTVSGSARPQQSWDLSAEGRLDLATLAGWVPQIERGSGLAEIGLEVLGPWSEPQVRGPIQILSGATLKLTGFHITLEDLDASAALDSTGRITLDWLDAQIRDGRLHLEGGMGLDHWRPQDLRFYAEIRDLDYQWPAQVEYRFDADALITGSVAEPEVRGEVRLQQFLYRRRIDWKRLVLEALNRKPRSVETRAQDGLFLDLAVRGRDDIRVENNVAQLDMAADLRVRGHLPAPTLWGRVDVVDGSVRFLGREYKALQSTVEFLGETQPIPQLDLHAQTLTRDYTVNVDVTGPLDRYQVSLSSVPYLGHTDIAALLTMGMTSQEVQDSNNMGGAQAAAILGEGLQEEFSAVGRVFGVDTFYIDSSYSSATQTTVPRVTIGKGITEELYARYSAAVGAETAQDVELEYTLTPRISLLGTWIDRETQDRGSLGGELRFRFPFR